MKDLKRRVEAFLFIISKGLKLHELAEKTGSSEKNVEKALKDLMKDYEERNSAFNIVNFKDLYRLNVDKTLVTGLSELVPKEFSKSMIKTLSVIAWKNGITQGEVIRIRGNKAYDHIKQLSDLGFVSLEPFGKTFKLLLTNQFFDYFNINKGEERFIFKQE